MKSVPGRIVISVRDDLGRRRLLAPRGFHTDYRRITRAQLVTQETILGVRVKDAGDLDQFYFALARLRQQSDLKGFDLGKLMLKTEPRLVESVDSSAKSQASTTVHPGRRGRMPKHDAEAKRVAMLALIVQHPTLKNDPKKLASEIGASESSVRRWLQAEEERYLESKK